MEISKELLSKDEYNKGQKQYRPNKSRRDQKEMAKTVPKNLNDLDNHKGLNTYLEPDILECEVKWALESTAINKTSGDNGILAERFKILKMMLLK